jgi:predicted ATPase
MSQLERAARFAHDDTAQAKLDKLDTLLALSFTSPEDAALFAEMLSLPNDGRYPVLELTPQQRRQRILEALAAQIKTLARPSPLLMILEDAHWADPTSLEAFGRVVMDEISALNVLLIVTYRPEFEPPWIGQPHVTTLTLNRLGRAEIAAMIDAVIDVVTDNKALPATIKQNIVERTDGIPLFIEEMTKALLEAGGQEGAERAVASIPAPSLAIPASLHASLMARLDRLGPAKEVAQIGAVIGREFSHALVARVARKEEVALRAALDDLTGAGLLFRHGAPPLATYLFKHGLVQDTAYSTLLRHRRQELHCRVVSVLQLDFPELIANQPEVLAHHCSEGGMISEAIEYYLSASQRATAAFNTIEASAHLRRAGTLLEKLPSSDPRKVQLQQRVMFAGWWY